MKKLVSLLTVLCLIFCGCGTQPPAETTVAAEEPTTVPPTTEMPTETSTESPTEPSVPTDPLTGETLEAPMESRVFAVTINNVPGAMPMYGVSKADLFFEMFVNDYCTRGLALFGDISQVKSVGSVRSLRYNFTDLCRIYDAVPVYAGASGQVLADLADSGLDNMNVGYDGAGYSYRDESRLNKVDTFNEAYRLKEQGAILNWFDITEKEGYFSLNSKMGDIMSSPLGKVWFAGLMLTLKKKMDESKKDSSKDSKEGKKSGGFSIDLKSLGNFTQMLSGFTVLRLTGMVGMVGVRFDKEELLKMNKQLNLIRIPKK